MLEAASLVSITSTLDQIPLPSKKKPSHCLADLSHILPAQQEKSLCYFTETMGMLPLVLIMSSYEDSFCWRCKTDHASEQQEPSACGTVRTK